MPEKNNLLAITPAYNYFVKDQIESISSNFNSIDVFVYHNPITEISNYLPIHELSLFTKRSLIEYSGKPENVSVMAVPAFFIPIDRQYSQLGQRHYQKILKIVEERKLQPDLIHSHFLWTSGYVGARLKERLQVPLIVSGYGYDLYDLPFKSPAWKERIRCILNDSDCIITVSGSLAECAKRLEVKRPVEVLPTGYDSKRFYPRDREACRRRLDLPLNKRIILSIGSLVKVKGHMNLIHAIGELEGRAKDILCIILGEGNLRNELQKEIKRCGLEKVVWLVGRKPREELPLWINACDIFVLASLNEGNPTVMFEALGCGIPFISTNVGGVSEIITSNEYGLICQSNDSTDLCNRIFEALNREWNRDAILNHALDYEWNKQKENLMEIYKRYM